MAEQQPSVGRIVHYKLSDANVELLRKIRKMSDSVPHQPGVQAHAGNTPQHGDILPMMIVRVRPDEGGPGIPGVNGQVFLDGNDVLWVTSVHEGPERGQWQWPPRT